MKKIYLLIIIASLTVSCNSVKRTQKYVARGDYNKAIDLAVKKLQKDKTSAKFDEHIGILEDAYSKVTKENLRNINLLRKDVNLQNVKEIYYTYRDLQDRQNLIRPLLPLYSREMGRNANFTFSDYSSELSRTKKDYVAALYQEAKIYFQRNTKEDFRTAYTILSELEEVQKQYKDVFQLKKDAQFRGTDFILVSINNHSGQMIPYRLEQELLAFNTFGLEQMWTEYHDRRENGIQYDLGIDLNFNAIEISPERILKDKIVRSTKIKDGYDVKKDRRGNVVKDSLGNPIRIEKFIDVSAEIYTTVQEKAVFVGGTIVYKDLIKRREINNYPLSCEFIFENIFATYRGDERALNAEDRRVLSNNFLSFPTNEQMVFDAGEEIKQQLRQILGNNPI